MSRSTKNQPLHPSSDSTDFVGTRLSTSLIEAIHYKCQLLFLSVWKSDNKGPSFFILESLPYSSSCVPDQHPQPFWHKGSILWKTFLSQAEGGRGMVSGWSGTLLLLHILFLLLCQPHLRLSGIWFWRLGSPVLDWHWLQRDNTWGPTWHILALAAALRTPFGPHAMPLSSCQLNRHFLYSHPPPLPSKCACKPCSSSFCQNLLPFYHPVFSPTPVIILCPPGLLFHGSPLPIGQLVLLIFPIQLDLWWPPCLHLHRCHATSGL